MCVASCLGMAVSQSQAACDEEKEEGQQVMQGICSVHVSFSEWALFG